MTSVIILQDYPGNVVEEMANDLGDPSESLFHPTHVFLSPLRGNVAC
jgi:hypothetical protein